MAPLFLELEEVLDIHQDQIKRYGGSEGVRDLGLLESALAVPRGGSQGQYFHADLFEMAAAYMFHLVKNHPFVDGNKRVGAVAAIVFLEINGVSLRMKSEALYGLVIAVVEGKIPKAGIAELFRKHTK